MAKHDNTYSHIVAWLKVLLPVIALVLLSTMFMISKSIDPDRALIYSDVNVDDIAESQRISGARFSGVTSDGAAVSFSADIAEPDADDPNKITVQGIKAEFDTPDGGVVNLEAALTRVDRTANLLVMSGGVAITTSTQYTIQTSGVRAALDSAWFESLDTVFAKGPIGQVEAGQLVLTQQDGDAGSYLLVFKHGVKMVYTPQPTKEP